MRKSLLLLSAFFIVVIIHAQTPADTTQKKGWRKGGVISINIGQGGSRNWAAGSEKYSVSIGGLMSVFAEKQMGKWNWSNNLDLAYSFINTESQGYRKTDDKIDFLTKFGRALAPKVNLTILGNFRTQFYYGYDYDYLGEGLERSISGFMAPAYITLAPGIDWKPSSSLSIFVTPISARWIVVSNKPYDYYYPGGVIPGGGYEKPKSVLYGVDPIKQVRLEAGGFASIQFAKEVMKNVAYKSKLDLFSNYLEGYEFLAPTYTTYIRSDPKPQNVDLYWTNTVVMKVNKFLAVTYSLDMIYDDDVKQFGDNNNSAALQIRSLLAVGVQAKF